MKSLIISKFLCHLCLRLPAVSRAFNLPRLVQVGSPGRVTLLLNNQKAHSAYDNGITMHGAHTACRKERRAS